MMFELLETNYCLFLKLGDKVVGYRVNVFSDPKYVDPSTEFWNYDDINDKRNVFIVSGTQQTQTMSREEFERREKLKGFQ